MRKPHWLDKVVDGKRTVDAVAEAICKDPTFRQLIQKGIDDGVAWEERVKENPKLLGTSFTQEVRVAITEGVAKDEI